MVPVSDARASIRAVSLSFSCASAHQGISNPSHRPPVVRPVFLSVMEKQKNEWALSFHDFQRDVSAQLSPESQRHPNLSELLHQPNFTVVAEIVAIGKA